MEKNDKNQGKGLKDYGIIYLSGSIVDEVSENVCREIIEYNLSEKVDHIQLTINSPGGQCPAEFGGQIRGTPYLFILKYWRNNSISWK